MLRALLFLLLTATMAQATPVEDLVSERAAETLGAEMPENGRFRITFQRKDYDEAELISAFWMDRATGQFLANAVLPGGTVMRLQGLAVLTLPVPVPTRRMMPGELIRAEDVQTVDLPFSRVGVFAITEPETLIGKEVRRTLTQGRPVLAQSITEPLVITRGDKVSIRFTDGRLSLSAPGRALDDGYSGAEIRVVNLVSNVLVTGVAQPGGLVEIVR
ncbi:MAG: flagellar basal body P-ring formation protein FlgA [Pseudooceanicola sp.]|nr:flagellar basal body P-ring formation protein FlgA [Pseudooceanicola sp.]